MRFLAILLASLIYLTSSSVSLAITNPLSSPNNRLGVHILSPDEIESAAKFVNHDRAGAWGYVTVPIQATDRDRPKWLHFMTKAKELQVIPIIRVATYAQGSNWLKPSDHDLVDFANFLNDLPWPTKNRYVIIFNEVNRADEFGGFVSPEEYTAILSKSIDIFKERNEDFFILPAGLDNAAPNGGAFMRWDLYLKRMATAVPNIFDKIDGWTSHAYGNPAFGSNPTKSGSNKADSFLYDLKLIANYTSKKLPVFITEAGWSLESVNPDTIATYYSYAFTQVWNHESIVSVNPFLLFAGAPPFSNFSLLDKSAQPTTAYKTLTAFASVGNPETAPIPTPQATPTPTQVQSALPQVLGDLTQSSQSAVDKVIIFLVKTFKIPLPLPEYLPKLSQVQVGSNTFAVEIASDPLSQAKGLAKYKSLNEKAGMLFIFKSPAKYTFWMKDMQFDIKLAWIKDSHIIGIEEMKASDQKTRYLPPVPVSLVLEVRADANIAVGDKVTLITP